MARPRSGPIVDQFNQAPPLNLPGIVNNDLVADLPTLVILLEHFLHNQPKNTRGYTQIQRSMEAWLNHRDQRNKMERISLAYPNTLGQDGNCDLLTNFSDLLVHVLQACSIITERLEEGVTWVDSFNEMSLALSEARAMLPKVQLSIGDRSELIAVSTTLVKSREQFWADFEIWAKKRVSDYCEETENGLLIMSCLLPNILEQENPRFTDMKHYVESSDLAALLWYIDGQYLNPETIDG